MSSKHGNQQVTDAEIKNRIEEVSEPVASAVEIAAAFPVTRTAINKRLNQLHEAGEVQRKDVGSGYVWWVVD